MKKQVPIVCYDMNAIDRFFRSVALAMALDQHTSTVWKTYKDSAVINTIYTVLFWKEPPGTAEVQVSDRAAIERSADQLHHRFLMAWVRKLIEGGPAAANHYASDMAILKENARRNLQETYAGAQEINSSVVSETRDGIRSLATIRLGASIGVAVIGASAGLAVAGATAAGTGSGAALTAFGLPLGASSATFGAVGTGYSVAGSVISTWEQAPSAKVAAVSMDLGKHVASDVSTDRATVTLRKAIETKARSTQAMNDAMRTFREQSQRLAQGGLKGVPEQRVTKSIRTSLATASRNQAAIRSAEGAAKLASRALYAVPVVFAALDIVQAVRDYEQATR